jgi:hypothetical protein
MKLALCWQLAGSHQLAHEALWRDWIDGFDAAMADARAEQGAAADETSVNTYCQYGNVRGQATYDKIRSPWLRSKCIPTQYSRPTSYTHVTESLFSLLLFALRHDEANEWFLLLTETCVPVVRPAEMARRFRSALGERSIVTAQPAHWDVQMHKRANLRLLPPSLRLANDPWAVYARRHVRQFMDFASDAQTAATFGTIVAGGIANESVFAVVLEVMQERDGPRHVNAASTLSDWARRSSPTSPHVFRDATDVELLALRRLLQLNRHSLVLRKVAASFPRSQIEALWDLTDGAVECPPRESGSGSCASRRSLRCSAVALACALFALRLLFLGLAGVIWIASSR